jgi:hypothetical protein
MLINKKITLLKFYRETRLEISSIQGSIQTVYRLKNNYFSIWNKNSYNFGEEQDFYFLEKDNEYIVISDFPTNDSDSDSIYDTSFSYEIDIGENNLDYEFVVNSKQICLYKGEVLSLGIFKNQIVNIYRVSDSGDSYLLWNSNSFNFGEEQDFNVFLNNQFYYIISKSNSYILWPPLNYNKSQSINNNNVNWGLFEHIR